MAGDRCCGLWCGGAGGGRGVCAGDDLEEEEGGGVGARSLEKGSL